MAAPLSVAGRMGVLGAMGLERAPRRKRAHVAECAPPAPDGRPLWLGAGEPPHIVASAAPTVPSRGRCVAQAASTGSEGTSGISWLASPACETFSVRTTSRKERPLLPAVALDGAAPCGATGGKGSKL